MEKRTERRASGRRSGEFRARVLEIFERRLVDRNMVPDAEHLLTRRHADRFQILVAVALGIAVGSFSILFNFILLNQLLHL